MKKRHIAALLFFLCFFGVAIMAMEFFPKENIILEEKDNVILSLKSKTASIVDSIMKNDNEENINNNGNSSNGENNIIEKVVSPTQEVINNTKDNTIERIEYIKEEIEKIVNSVTAPINQTTNSLAKQLISWLLSLLSPEEIREIFAKDFDIDICR